MTDTPYFAQKSLNKHLLIGIILVFCLLGGLGTWAAFASISGAVIAHGTVVVETNVKRVQHRDGGIVGKIFVKNGDYVSAGDLLIKLDDTLTKANLAILTKQIDELMARQVRLEAELNAEKEIIFPQSLILRKNEEHVRKALKGESILFSSKRTILKSQKEQLGFRITQLREQIIGLTSQRDAKSKEIKLISQELVSLERLFKQGLVPSSRILALRREKTRLEGEHGQLTAQIAATKGGISEVKLQLNQIEQKRLTEIAQELREVQTKIVELAERKITAEDQLKRIDIRSPRNGYVHQLTVHTVGGVITAGETFAHIVPQEDTLLVEAKLNPGDIDQISKGQHAVLRFPAFNQRTTPELIGDIKTISADLSHDPNTGASYYLVRLTIKDIEAKKLGTKQLVPGMPVETFIQTEQRTVASYLLKPLKDQIVRSLREE